MLCAINGGTFSENIETTGIGYFSEHELPDNLAVEKTTKEQVLMCFEAYKNPDMETVFD